MAQNDAGVTKLENGNWEYRFVMVVDGKKVTSRKRKDEQGNPLTTKRAAIKARQAAMKKAQMGIAHTAPTAKRTVAEVYREYCEKGRSGKAYTTIRKQDSLWDNHLSARFGHRYIDDTQKESEPDMKKGSQEHKVSGCSSFNIGLQCQKGIS